MMEAGAKLDRLVSKKIFGFELEYADDIPKFSSELDSAFIILDELHGKGFVWCIEQSDIMKKPTVHILHADKRPERRQLVHFIEDMEKISESAESLPHAICLAALKAIE